jgi:hypothetical protein
LVGLLGAVDKLEALHLDICPSAFAFTSAYTAFKDALETQHTTLRELRISPRTPCRAHFRGNNNYRPWSFWSCINLRTLSIPVELYNHYQDNIPRATHFLIPAQLETLTISLWHFNRLQPPQMDFLAQDTAICFQLQKVVLQDLVGGQAQRMATFAHAQQEFATRNVKLAYQDCSAQAKMRCKEECPWRK